MNKLATLGFFLILFSNNLALPQEKNITPYDEVQERGGIDFRINSTQLDELLSESFEDDTFPPSGWKKVTINGSVVEPGWQRLSEGDPVTGFQDDGNPIPFNFPAPGGGSAVAHCSWQTGDPDGDFATPSPTDQWLITPQLMGIQPGDSLKFVLSFFEENIDTVDVLVSTSEDTVTDFTTVVDTITNPGNANWNEYRYALTDFVAADSDIFIAFRQHVTNTTNEGDAVFLDLVRVVRDTPTTVEESSPLPADFALKQNYPNPFNPTTTIGFSLPRRSVVSLKIYDILGKNVANLVDQQPYTQGEHTIEFNAADLPTGLYFYRLQADDFIETRKLTVIK